MGWSSRVGFISLGVIAITATAAGLTEATLARSRSALITDGRGSVGVPLSSVPLASPWSPSVSPTVVPSASVTPAALSSDPTATTNAFVHMRAAATVASAIVANLDGGTVVLLRDYVDPQWQEVSVNAQVGYIYRAYLTY